MPTYTTRDEVRRLIGQGARLLEVLGRDEFEEAHLPGAINIPLDELTPEALSGLDPKRPVITYCYDTQCDMSPRAAWRLESLGFEQVYEYAPGKADWMGAGLPIEGAAADIPTAGQLARDDVPTCHLDTPLSDIRRQLEASEWDTCFVVNSERVVLGRMYLSQLESLDRAGDATAADAMDPGPSTFRPDVTAVELAQRMAHDELQTAPVTSSDGRLIGLALREDVERTARATDTSRLPDGSNPQARRP